MSEEEKRKMQHDALDSAIKVIKDHKNTIEDEKTAPDELLDYDE